MFLLVALFNVVLSVSAKNELYIGHKVYNVKLQTEEQANSFHLLKSDLIDYWRKPSLKHGVVGKAMVPPSHFDWFEKQLAELQIERDIAIEDVYEYIKENESKVSRISRNEEDKENEFDFNSYYRYDEILNYTRRLESEYKNSTSISLSVVEAGVTDEGRPLIYIRVRGVNSNSDTPIAVVEAGIIPREWITIPSALNIVKKLLDEEQKRLVDNFDWIIIPVLNPDGYEYTHTNLRLWTKNRSMRSNLGFICPGVNINRNFDIEWLVSDISSSACSHIFGGLEPFSEPETVFVRNVLEQFGDRLRLYISVQNSGGFISYPWQYERAASGMFRQHHLLGLDMVAATNETYRLDVGFSALGDRASGTGSDYAMENGAIYTFNIDVVQRGDIGVNVPEEEIVIIAEDVWRAVRTAAVRIISD